MSDPLSQAFIIPSGAADYVVRAGVAFAGRQPFREVVEQLMPGDPVRLCREPDNRHDPHAILVIGPEGRAAGYLYAAEAAYLSLLLDLAPPERDDSRVVAIDGKKVWIEVRLHLADVAPIFTLIALLGLKNEHFASDFNLTQNDFLRPLLPLNRACISDYDRFRLPTELVDAFIRLRSDASAAHPRDRQPGLSEMGGSSARFP